MSSDIQGHRTPHAASNPAAAGEPADPPVAQAGVAGEIRSTLRRMRWFRRMPVLHIAEERGEGPTVLLLHGIASSSVTFHHVIPLLERTHRCIAIDLLGFGESPAPEWADYTLADHVAAIERTVASLRLREPFIVVGHSMGALIGARYAARRQKRVAKLVMVSPPIYLAPHEIGDVIERVRMDFYLRLYEYLRTNREFTLRHAALVQRLLPIPKAVDITERNWEPFIKSLQHSIESQTTLSDIAHVKAPIDVIMGDLDEFRSEAVLRIVERMKGVTVRRVRATNHLIGKRLAQIVATTVTTESSNGCHSRADRKVEKQRGSSSTDGVNQTNMGTVRDIRRHHIGKESIHYDNVLRSFRRT